MSTLSSHLLEEIKALPGKYPQPRSAVMPALDLAQEELGHLTPDAMTEVAEALQLDPGYVEGVATFYTLFHLQPIGRHRFYVCTNLSCTLRGAEDIVDRLKGAIGVHEPGEVSKDGLFSYEEVECLGACEYAPVCRLDHRYQVDLTRAKIEAGCRQAAYPLQRLSTFQPLSPRPSERRVSQHFQPPPRPSPPKGVKGQRARRKKGKKVAEQQRGTEMNWSVPDRMVRHTRLHELDVYESLGGYSALRKGGHGDDCHGVIDEVKASGCVVEEAPTSPRQRNGRSSPRTTRGRSTSWSTPTSPSLAAPRTAT